jgi:hypothetical protein
MRHRILMSSLAAACIAVAVPSCLFDTRDAQDPVTGSGACTLESPGKWKVCMTQAVNEQKDANYERTLSPTFLFSPTQADSLDQNFIGTDVYVNWNKDRELAVLGTLFSEATTTTVDFGDLQTIINKSTFVRFRSTYTLEVITPNTPNPPDTTIYKGIADIDVHNEGGQWKVTYWNEIETVPGFSTWGFLRGILGLRT